MERIFSKEYVNSFWLECSCLHYEGTLPLHITSKLLPVRLRNIWSNELWTIPHSSKMWHQSATSNSANSNITSVQVRNRGNGVWRHCGNWHLRKTGRWWRVVEKCVHCSTFVRCVRFFRICTVSCQGQCTDCSRQRSNYIAALFQWRAWYHATFDLLRQWLLLNMHDKITSTYDKTIISISIHYK